MFKKWQIALPIVVLIGSGVILNVATAQKDEKPAPSKSRKIVIGEDEVKQLLLLMDTDKNGKISKQEYMNFMAAEFDRLDKDKSGELDPKELTQSQIRVSHFTSVGK